MGTCQSHSLLCNLQKSQTEIKGPSPDYSSKTNDEVPSPKPLARIDELKTTARESLEYMVS